jgi:hypothetical protein
MRFSPMLGSSLSKCLAQNPPLSQKHLFSNQAPNIDNIQKEHKY